MLASHTAIRFMSETSQKSKKQNLRKCYWQSDRFDAESQTQMLARYQLVEIVLFMCILSLPIQCNSLKKFPLLAFRCCLTVSSSKVVLSSDRPSSACAHKHHTNRNPHRKSNRSERNLVTAISRRVDWSISKLDFNQLMTTCEDKCRQSIPLSIVLKFRFEKCVRFLTAGDRIGFCLDDQDRAWAIANHTSRFVCSPVGYRSTRVFSMNKFY